MKINKEQIKEVIINLPQKIKQVLKTVYGLPHSGKYFILALVLFILFFITTFPYDFLIKKKIHGLEGKKFRSVEMSGFDFSLFGETYIDNMIIVLNSNNELTCKHSILNIALNPVTLFINDKLKSDFQFDLLKYTSKDYELIFNINGNMDCTLDKKSGQLKNGPVKIILSDSIIKLNNLNVPGPMGPLNLKFDSINIQSGNIDAVITNGNLKFNTFKLTGNDMACDIIGSVDIANSSKLDLTVSIDSESTVLDQYRDILASFIKNNVLTLRIKGTTTNPEFTLLNPAKNEN